jgi:hypothetical protein
MAGGRAGTGIDEIGVAPTVTIGGIDDGHVSKTGITAGLMRVTSIDVSGHAEFEVKPAGSKHRCLLANGGC